MKIFESIPVEKPNSFFLKEINTPEDLRKFKLKDLDKISDELRQTKKRDQTNLEDLR